MKNQDNTDNSDGPSLGNDIREQIRTQDQPAAQEIEAQSPPLEEEEEAWWLKYVKEEPEGTSQPVVTEVADINPPPEVIEPEPPIQETPVEISPIHESPEDVKVLLGGFEEEQAPVHEAPVSATDLPPLPLPPETEEITESLPPVFEAPMLAIDLPPSPPPPEIEGIAESLPPVPLPLKAPKIRPLDPPPTKVEVVPAALPPPPAAPQPEREILSPEPPPPSESKPVEKTVSAELPKDNASVLEKVPSRIALPKKSMFKLWPFVAGGIAAIAAVFFVPFTFVPDIVVEGKVEEEEQALLADYSGKVETIFIQKWEKVQAGEPLIKLQSEQLEEEMEALTTTLKMRYEGLFQEHQNEIAKLNRIIVKSEIDYKALSSENEAIDRQLKNLDAYLARQEVDPETESRPVKNDGIAERKSVLSADYAKNQSSIAKLFGEIATAESDIKQLITKVQDLQEKEFLDMANLEEENKYQSLIGKSDQLILKAPVTGSVSELQFKEGQSIVKGDTILRIVSDPDRIEIMIPEERMKEYSVGDFVWVKESSKKLSFLKVPITVMSPKINNEDPLLESGRSVFLSYPTESALLPGQKVSVHLNNPGETGLQSVHRKISRKFEYAKRRD